MTGGQKGVVLLSLVAFAVAFFNAPYRYSGREIDASRMATGMPAVEAVGTLWAPAWSPPTDQADIQVIAGKVLQGFRVELDAGKLGLILAGIAIATAAVVALAAPSRDRASFEREPSETERLAR